MTALQRTLADVPAGLINKRNDIAAAAFFRTAWRARLRPTATPDRTRAIFNFTIGDPGTALVLTARP